MVSGHRVAELRFVAGRQEEVLLTELGERAIPIWSGLVGPLDADGETTQELVVGPGAIEVFRTAARVIRCDGRKPRLGRQVWSFDERRLRLESDPLPPVKEPVISAQPAMDAKNAGGFFWIAASAAEDAPTAWKDAAGGDFVTARSAAPLAVTGLRVRARTRLRLAVLLGPTETFDVEVAAEGRPLWVPLPHPVTSSCVTVAFREPGGIVELEVVTAADGPDRLVETIARGDECETRVPMLTALGRAALPALVTAIPAASGAGRECLVQALTQLVPEVRGDPRTGEALAAALVRASRTEQRLIFTALPRLQSPPTAALSRTLADEAQSEDDRIRVARALALLTDGIGPLLAAAGTGPDALRVAIRELMGAARPPAASRISAALEATPATQTARRADLLFALGAVAAREPDPHRRAMISAALEDPAFEVRARAVGALGRLAEADALARLRATSNDPVLRYLAVRELASVPGSETALRAALADADPRVRETAALGLGQKQDRGATELILAAMAHERWPAVRRAQVEALGGLCGPAAADRFVQVIARERDDVRRVAMSGLVRCRDPRARDVLLKVLGRRKEDPDLRGSAARLIGELGDRVAAPELVAVLARLRMESQEDLALEGVAVATVHTLAVLGGRPAIDGALGLLADERPALKKAAVEALGRLCDGDALKKAAMEKDEAIAASARASQRRCRERR